MVQPEIMGLDCQTTQFKGTPLILLTHRYTYTTLPMVKQLNNQSQIMNWTPYCIVEVCTWNDTIYSQHQEEPVDGMHNILLGRLVPA